MAPHTTLAASQDELYAQDAPSTAVQHQEKPLLVGSLLKQDATATAAEPANTRHARHVQGFFELVPDSWQHQLLTILPSTSKWALFTSSRRLARHVMDTAPRVTLNLKQRCTAEQTEARRVIITRLLSMGQQGITVQLWPGRQHPFPTALANRVISLTLCDGVNLSPTSCPWDAMTSLHTLQLAGWPPSEGFLSGLCEAVAAGQLQRLRNLQLHVSSMPQHLDQLMHTLGPQLEELTTSCAPLIISQVPELEVLHRLVLKQCTVSDDMMQHMCKHPTLCHVTLHSCAVQSGHIERSCNWETLTIIQGNRRHTLKPAEDTNCKQLKLCPPSYCIMCCIHAACTECGPAT